MAYSSMQNSVSSGNDMATIEKCLHEELVSSGAWKDGQTDTSELRRFLSANKSDIAASKQQWMEMQQWRAANHVDMIFESFEFTELSEYLRVFPQGYHKTDFEGRPVFYQQVGRVDLDALMAITTEQRMLSWHIHEYERLLRVILPACSHAAGSHVEQSFSVLDLEGLKFRDFLRTRKLMTMFLKMDQANYPETLGRMVIINAPDWFSGAFGFVRQFMSASMQERVEIVGKAYLPVLQRYIPRENIPAAYGGSSLGELSADLGPWRASSTGESGAEEDCGAAPRPLRCNSPTQRVGGLGPRGARLARKSKGKGGPLEGSGGGANATSPRILAHRGSGEDAEASMAASGASFFSCQSHDAFSPRASHNTDLFTSTSSFVFAVDPLDALDAEPAPPSGFMCCFPCIARPRTRRPSDIPSPAGAGGRAHAGPRTRGGPRASNRAPYIPLAQLKEDPPSEDSSLAKGSADGSAGRQDQGQTRRGSAGAGKASSAGGREGGRGGGKEGGREGGRTSGGDQGGCLEARPTRSEQLTHRGYQRVAEKEGASAAVPLVMVAAGAGAPLYDTLAADTMGRVASPRGNIVGRTNSSSAAARNVRTAP